LRATDSVYVLRVNVKAYTNAYSPNVFAVVDDGKTILIDTGLPDDDSVHNRLEYLHDLGDPRVELIVVTHHHFDHAGGANRLRKATGAPVAMHPNEERLLHDPSKTVVDRRIGGGDVVQVGKLTLRIVDTPGHSAGHICVYLEEEQVLFSGDNVLGLGTTAIPPPPDGDMQLYVESLEKMKALDARLICPGHGPLVHEPRRKIQELIDHRREREEQVLALLREGKRTPSEMLRAIYPELDPRLERMAMGQIVAHLYKLRDDGKVALRCEGDEDVWGLS
jgi:endoribonuclease LACTB2